MVTNSKVQNYEIVAGRNDLRQIKQSIAHMVEDSIIHNKEVR